MVIGKQWDKIESLLKAVLPCSLAGRDNSPMMANLFMKIGNPGRWLYVWIPDLN
jgi:hypothetical protein